MGIIRRLILLFYIPAVLTVLAICAGVCLKLIPEKLWQSELQFLIARDETLIAIAIMTVAGVILWTAVFSRSKSTDLTAASGTIHLEVGKPGEVKVAVNAIIGVVERTAITISGVRDASAAVYKQSGDMPIKIRLAIVLSQGFSAPKVSEAAVAAVDEALLTTLQLPKVPVEVTVEEVTHAILERDKRVV
ncbi:MAG: alkaline shock response membrane anchor protein AmaP [Selenomonadaceae bacterium]|nr:alkaline shock response membrane anchor protein AmaP [Selenomonadaceae bacterium]